MKWRSALIFSIPLIALPLLARDKSDVIVMKNGDRLTCEIKSLDSGVLYASLDYVDGTISVQWSKVARVESTQQFIVTTANGSVYAGLVKTAEMPADSPVRIEVEAEGSHMLLERALIVELNQTSQRFWQRFNGALGWGITYSKGNQSTQYNLNSNLDYIRERWWVGAAYIANLSANNGSDTSTRNQVSLGATHLLPWNNYFYSGLAEYLQSSSQGIDRQTTFGGGVGRYLKRANRMKWSVLGGLAWQRTSYQPALVPEPTQNLAAAIVTTELKAFKFKKTNLDISASLLPALSEPGRVHFNTNASYYVKLFSNFNWNVSFYGNWDNRPPPTFSSSDYGSSSGISWTFGNR